MRVAIVSDVHANLPALQAVLDDAGAVDTIWCPGDLVGYGPNPNECVELLREGHATCIAGNHDWAAIDRLSTADFNPDAARAAEWTAKQLSPENKLYLENLPVSARTNDFTIVHGTLLNPIWEYLLSPSQATESFAKLQTSYALVGHSHLPLAFLETTPNLPASSFDPPHDYPIKLGQERLILNPGSVGQPRDGNPAASYCLLDLDSRSLQFRRVPYDIQRTQRLMQLHNLPERLWQRLSYGW